INRYKQQQLDTRKNEEYTALRHEIDTAEKAIVKIEDVELELMEENEQVKPGIQQAETLYSEKKNFVQKQISENTDKHNTIKKRIEELEAERAKLVESVDEDLLELYDRLFKSKGDAAVVPLDHEVCMGCHMKATAQTAVRVKPNKEIIHCTQCGRILYHID
ncbi:MAG: C4-type zinc ribbon domain-containing protein, partial [Chthoniobacterales bacterium]